jgi:ubiquinone/menaquinone biosynthesis C-methylase UbiE
MSAGDTADYVHGYASAEQERLFAQAEHWRYELILDGTTLTPGTRLLEVGCGVGAVLGVLGTAFPGLVLAGVDIESRQLDVARRHLRELGLEVDLRQADANALPYPDDSFDHIWMMWFLEHVADPVAVLREARRVLIPGGRLTAIEVDYNTVWSSPANDDFDALFDAMAGAMEASGRSDAGSRLPGWLADAGFADIDPGERPCRYSGAELARQVGYVESVVDATLPELEQMEGASATELEAGAAHLRALPAIPDAALGWTFHKSQAVS